MAVPRPILAVLFATAALAACRDDPAPTTPAPREGGLAPLLSSAPGAVVIPDRYFVVFRDEVANPAALSARLAAAHRGTLHHTYQHAFKGFAATLSPAAVAALRSDPRVAYIEPDHEMRITATQYYPPWGLDRVDQRYLPRDSMYTYGTSGDSVDVYVIDTGIHLAHPEFGGRARLGFDACYGGCNAGDPQGHGTHVAGIIGAATYGVAKRVDLIAIRVTSNSGGSTATVVARGVDTVTARKRARPGRPAVANISLGGPVSATLDTAVVRSIRAGVVYTIGAGNDTIGTGLNACDGSPARVDSALTVAATNSRDGRVVESVSRGFRWSSNFGRCVDLFAPGDSIVSTWNDGGVMMQGGTSMSAPFVAGLAARYMGLYRTALPAEVNSFIISNATAGVVTNPGAETPNRLLYTTWGGKRRACCSSLQAGLSGGSVRDREMGRRAGAGGWLMLLVAVAAGAVQRRRGGARQGPAVQPRSGPR
ncbi:MAG TPA: S8 family peptidase [Longimicrobium sp.]|nr:S8 family peptidase [Longimicrobium sp.]